MNDKHSIIASTVRKRMSNIVGLHLSLFAKKCFTFSKFKFLNILLA